MKPGPLRLLAIDPAKIITGWALIDAEGARIVKIAASGVLKNADAHDIEDFSKKLVEDSAPPTLLAIEDQFLSNNVHSLKTIVEFRARFQQAFESKGVPSVLVSAQAWQMGMLKGLIGLKSPREARKKAAMTLVKQLYDPSIKSQDVADAICIGVWAIKNGYWKSVVS